AAVVQVQLVFRLMHDDQGRGRDIVGGGALHRSRHAPCQRHCPPQVFRRISIAHHKIIACSRYDIIGSSSRPGILGPMRIPRIPVILLIGFMAGCSSLSSNKPVEVLDERTAVTFGALKEPIELVPGAQNAVLILGKHISFAYLGPVEWNRSGALSYGLWIHIAPGVDQQPGDIHAPAAVALILDEGPLALTLMEAPRLGNDPYRQVVSWGQTAYFGVDVESLKRMAGSRKLELEVRAPGASSARFASASD